MSAALWRSGNPAPEILHAPRTSEFRIGLIPHLRDREKLSKVALPDDLLVINVSDDWETVIANILRCDKIISSSLHGIIIAEAYGIPALWWRPSFGEGAIKYIDYYGSTGRFCAPIYSLDEALSLQVLPDLPNLEPLQDGIIAAFKEYGHT